MPRCLVIDDDNTLRQLMVMTLESAGYAVAAAAHGAEAALAFQGQPADVVVTDIVMPDDSLDHVLALRQRHPAVPFVIVSASLHSPRTQEIARQLGARRTLAKPFRLPDLLGVVDEIVADLAPRPGVKPR